MNALVIIGTCSTVISKMTVLLTCFALIAILLDMTITLTLEAIYVISYYLFDLRFFSGFSLPYEVLPF